MAVDGVADLIGQGGGAEVLGKLVTFVNTLRCLKKGPDGKPEKIDVPLLRTIARRIWNWWIRLLTLVFPADKTVYPPAFIDAGFCPLFDPLRFAISAACHNMLLHAADYVEWCGDLYHAAIESAGEAAVFQLTCMFREFNMYRMRLHSQASWNLIRGICNCFGRLESYDQTYAETARRYTAKKRAEPEQQFNAEDFVDRRSADRAVLYDIDYRARQARAGAGARGRAVSQVPPVARAGGSARGRGRSAPRRPAVRAVSQPIERDDSNFGSDPSDGSRLDAESSGNETDEPE